MTNSLRSIWDAMSERVRLSCSFTLISHFILTEFSGIQSRLTLDRRSLSTRTSPRELVLVYLPSRRSPW